MASAVSVHDLWERAKQFWPKNRHARVSLQYTSCLKVNYMIQRRQFQRDLCDSHYAAAVFKYMREYAVSIRNHCLFVSLDDKHRLKDDEPGFPVASAERRRRVIVKRGTIFEVGDHDFT